MIFNKYFNFIIIFNSFYKKISIEKCLDDYTLDNIKLNLYEVKIVFAAYFL